MKNMKFLYIIIADRTQSFFYTKYHPNIMILTQLTKMFQLINGNNSSVAWLSGKNTMALAPL